MPDRVPDGAIYRCKACGRIAEPKDFRHSFKIAERRNANLIRAAVDRGWRGKEEPIDEDDWVLPHCHGCGANNSFKRIKDPVLEAAFRFGGRKAVHEMRPDLKKRKSVDAQWDDDQKKGTDR